MNTYVKLDVDLFASNQNNYIAETITPTPIPNSAYTIITPFQGGFYLKDIEVYDLNDNLLKLDIDYVASYYFKDLSKTIGLDVYQAIIIINPDVSGPVGLQARYVGGDVAYSTTVIQDYINYWENDKHVPFTGDYVGYAPKWQPGELDQLRWGSDKYYNLNYALFELSRTLRWSAGNIEDTYRQNFDVLDTEYQKLADSIVNHVGDYNNPHNLTNVSINLDYLHNFGVASYAQLINNVPDLYVTPSISMSAIQLKFIIPYNDHINTLGNPHNNTAEDYGSYSVSYVDNALENKWTVTETVNVANSIIYNEINYDTTALVKYLNALFNSGNFTGLINADRLGTYSETNPVLKDYVLNNDQQWKDWNTLLNDNSDYLGYPITILPVSYATKADAASAANSLYPNKTNGLIKYTIERTIGGTPIKTYGFLNNNNGTWE